MSKRVARRKPVGASRPSPGSERAAPWRRLASATYLAFFFSGLCALFYQIIWLRALSNVFGNTTFAMSVTLSAFMAGLALGSYVFGRWGDRLARPLRLYAWLEIIIGVYGLASLSLLRAVHLGYIALAGQLSFDSFLLASFQFFASFLALLIPTALMGGTLPVATKGLVRRLEAVGPEVGKLYGVNTFGAAAGVLLVGFFLLPVLGLRGSVSLAAVINLLVGMGILRLEARGRAAEPPAARGATEAPEPRPSAPPSASPLSRPVLVILVVGFAFAGFSGLALEVVWARAFSLYVGGSVYAFSAVLLAVLIGIAFGSILVARLTARRQVTLTWFAGVQLGAGFSTLALIILYNLLAFAFLRVVLQFAETFPVLLGVEVLVIVGLLFVPTLCAGAALPILSRIYVGERASLSRAIGFLYAANTVGCIVGASAAGFLLIPALGLRATAVLCAGLYVVTGAAVLLSVRGRRLAGGMALAVLAVVVVFLPSWRPEIMSAGVYRRAGMDPAAARAYLRNHREVVFYRDGALATVAVVKAGNGHTLLINGKPDASDESAEMDTQTMLAHLPLLLADRHDSVLVVGLGSGTTSGTASLYPVRRIDCLEIEPAVVDAARSFRHVNRDVFADPRFHLIVADARNYLAATRRRYDVIINEPSNPWVAGVASLFTVEHFQALRDRLSPEGIVCQWLHIYQMSPHDLASIVATFVDVFPDATMWCVSRNHVDLALIARKHPWEADFPQLERRVGRAPTIRQDLRRALFDSPISVMCSLVLGPDDLRRLAEGGQLNTDDLPWLEFSAPRNVYLRGVVQSNWIMLTSYRTQALDEIVDLGAAGDDADARAALAQSLLEYHRSPLLRASYLGCVREQLLAAITLAPDRADLHESLARVELPMGDTPSARAHLQRALAIDPDRASAQELSAEIGR
ncbi:MAG: fused MFS/spermidine synthase [Armatimonadota bacterium]|nr:MAG: fused MFS/spermidine synthase [Armatimonadota bacterium]